jgi:hypothetical protein
MWSSESPLAAPVNFPIRVSPVSQAFQIPKSIQGDRIRQALKVLDTVHDNGGLMKLPIDFIYAKTFDGAYRLESDPSGRFYVGRRLDISRFADSPEFALYHEIGHILDHQIWGGGVDSGSEMNVSELQAWRTATVRSRAFIYLMDMRHKKRATIFTEDNQTYSIILDKKEIRIVDYLLRWSELLARSYCQYIITRSNEPALRSVLAKEREQFPNTIYFAIQWSDDDFEPIARAFDQIFVARHWR